MTWEINNTKALIQVEFTGQFPLLFFVHEIHKLLGGQKLGSFYKYFKIGESRKLLQINVMVAKKQKLNYTETQHYVPIVIFPNRQNCLFNIFVV